VRNNVNLFHFLGRQNATERTTLFSPRVPPIVYAIIYCKHDPWSYGGSHKSPRVLVVMVLLLQERFAGDLSGSRVRFFEVIPVGHALLLAFSN
jgi:hypothetical protein